MNGNQLFFDQSIYGKAVQICCLNMGQPKVTQGDKRKDMEPEVLCFNVLPPTGLPATILAVLAAYSAGMSQAFTTADMTNLTKTIAQTVQMFDRDAMEKNLAPLKKCRKTCEVQDPRKAPDAQDKTVMEVEAQEKEGYWTYGNDHIGDQCHIYVFDEWEQYEAGNILDQEFWNTVCANFLDMLGSDWRQRFTRQLTNINLTNKQRKFANNPVEAIEECRKAAEMLKAATMEKDPCVREVEAVRVKLEANSVREEGEAEKPKAAHWFCGPKPGTPRRTSGAASSSSTVTPWECP